MLLLPLGPHPFHLLHRKLLQGPSPFISHRPYLDPSIELDLAEVGTIKTLLSIHQLHFTYLLVHSALEVDTTHAVLALACPLACYHYLPFEPSLYSITGDSTFVAAATHQGELAQLSHLPAQGCLQGNKPAD